MKTRLAILTLLSACILHPASLPAQGSLTPPGAPAATMKSLAQVEPRTPIASAPFTITNSGSYYLTTNLTVSSGNAISIATNGVTLDLNGFTIASTAASATGIGIVLSSGLGEIALGNGHIRGGVTNQGGIYSGSGFYNGISYSGIQPANVLVFRLTVSGCLNSGLDLGPAKSAVVDSCTVRTVGGVGIIASAVKGSVALDCGGSAISGSQISDSRGESTGNGSGIVAEVVQNCYALSSGGLFGIYASTVQNCFAYNNGSGTGIGAYTAQNCYGGSIGGTGLMANSSAINCTGLSNGSGYGIHANYSAFNCFGYSATGIGLYAQVANTCAGQRNGGMAIQATIGIGCSAITGTNGITYKYNMP